MHYFALAFQEDAIVFQLGLGTGVPDRRAVVSRLIVLCVLDLSFHRVCLPVSRYPVKLEAHSIVTVRDWWVGFRRDESQQLWTVDMKLYCETPDVAVDHQGTLSVSITDDDGTVISSNQYAATLSGGEGREVTVVIESFTVPFSKVVNACPGSNGSIE